MQVTSTLLLLPRRTSRNTGGFRLTGPVVLVPVSPPAPSAPSAPSGLERALFGGLGTAAVDRWVAGAVREALGVAVTAVLFRAGRIDAVYGVRLADGRDAVVKVHRPPADPAVLAATGEVLDLLAAAGCPRLLGAPVARDGRVATVQSFLAGGAPADASRPAVRRALAASLAEQVDVLRRAPGIRALAARLGPGPAWTRHGGGPWPVPHDPIFDFSRTPAGWEWLDEFAREAADGVRRHRGTDEPVVAHGDFYAGNVLVADPDGDARVVAVVDWDLVVEPEAVVAGLTAGGLLHDRAPSPEEVAAFLDDHAAARGRAPGGRDRAEAAAAARWVLAFNARCDLAMLAPGEDPDPGSALGRVAADRTAYRALG